MRFLIIFLFCVFQLQAIEQGFVPIRDGLLYYEKTGVGTPIIVVHGGPGLDHGYLKPLASQLSHTHQLIFYDQRGSGKSLQTPFDEAHMNMNQFVEDLESLRKSLGFEKFILLGHSWGGFLSMNYAIRYPQHVAVLILMNSCPADSKGVKAFQDEFTTRGKNLQIKPLFSYEEFSKLNAVEISQLYRTLFTVYMYDPKMVCQLPLDFELTSARGGFRVMQLMETAWSSPDINLFPDLKKLSMPTFVLHGKQDIVPVWTAMEIKEAISSAEIVILDKCGHFAYIEQPAQCMEALNHFLKEKIHGDLR